MDCPRALRMLHRRLDDDLPDEAGQALEQHLQGCLPCRRRAGELTALTRAAVDLPEPPAPDVRGAVLDRIARESARVALPALPGGEPWWRARSFWAPTLELAAAAAMAAIALDRVLATVTPMTLWSGLASGAVSMTGNVFDLVAGEGPALLAAVLAQAAALVDMLRESVSSLGQGWDAFCQLLARASESLRTLPAVPSTAWMILVSLVPTAWVLSVGVPAPVTVFHGGRREGLS
ncbi:MAG: zf-HC2 domain-containing protein [Candidatus Riflebacteria bacterium]|nr:zf-HC2 domain-containing protein [Candidatus Riflebacteria bacterium]